MESNNGHSHLTEDEDRISMFPDDILVSILGKVNIATAVRASSVSTRWRRLPWLLPQLNIDVNDFLCDPCSDPIVAEHLDEAMASLTKASKSLLAVPQSKQIITKLCIWFFLISNHSSGIGQIVNDAIHTGMVKDVELTSGIERDVRDVSDEEMIQHAQSVNNFLGAYPGVSCCLTKLTLYNATFAEPDMHNLIINICKQLRHLSLFNCDVGYRSILKIDAPNSQLSFLELQVCSFERVELLCLPKLEYIHCDSWVSKYAPVSFGFVPSLEQIQLFCATTYFHHQFKLSELLHGTTDIRTLTLDFQGEKIWLQPEGKQLLSVFNKLHKLSIHGVFIEFGLLWTTAFVEVAPSLQILDIEVWDHPCEVGDEEIKRVHPERRNGSWKMFESMGSKHWPLKELRLCGFVAEEQQMVFIRAVMERAHNLETIILEEEYCDCCNAVSTPGCSDERRFPKNKDVRYMVVKNLRDRVSSPAQIIFSDFKFPSDYEGDI